MMEALLNLLAGWSRFFTSSGLAEEIAWTLLPQRPRLTVFLATHKKEGH